MRAVTIFVLFVSFGAHAADYPGSMSSEELWEICSGKESEMEKCATFISGVRSGMAAQRMMIGFTLANQKTDKPEELLYSLTSKEPFCSEKKVTNREIIEAFNEFMERINTENPKLLAGGAGASVLLGAQQQYPCK